MKFNISDFQKYPKAYKLLTLEEMAKWDQGKKKKPKRKRFRRRRKNRKSLGPDVLLREFFFYTDGI
jgi:hypothetical protein